MPVKTKLKIKVVPGASRPGIVGWLGDALKVRIAAPPEKGKANRELLQLLSRQLQFRESDIAIVSGAASQVKTVEIKGATMSDISEKVAAQDAC